MNLILLWPEDWKEREEEGENKVDESGAHAAQETTSSVTGTGSSRHAHTVRGSAVLADDRRVGHVRNVIRAQVGDSLKVGEVDGLIGTATVTVLAHDRVVLDVRLTLPPPPPSPVTLVLALPEKTTFAHVLHQVTVLGVKRVYVVGAAAVPGSWWGSHVLRRDSIREMLTLGLEQTIDTLMPVVHLRQVGDVCLVICPRFCCLKHHCDHATCFIKHLTLVEAIL